MGREACVATIFYLKLNFLKCNNPHFKMSVTSQFFTMNGYHFENWIHPINKNIIVYLKAFPPRRIGIISGDKVYFDNRMLGLLGDFSLALWHDTLNYAISDNIVINQTYNDQRGALQQILHEMRKDEFE